MRISMSFATKWSDRGVGSLFVSAALLVGALGIEIASVPATAGAQQHRPSLSLPFSQQTSGFTDSARNKAIEKFSDFSTLMGKAQPQFEGVARKVAAQAVQPNANTFFTTIVVTTTHDVTGVAYDTCTTVANNSCSLRAALSKAFELETTADPDRLPVAITLPAGTYQLNHLTATHFSALSVESIYGVVIKGAGETATKILATKTPTNPDRVFNLSPSYGQGALVLSTLTISGGRAPYRNGLLSTATKCVNKLYAAYIGGDIADCNNDFGIVLNHVRVTNGLAAGGGGIFSQGPLWINDSLITGNEASNTFTATLPTSFSASGGGVMAVGQLKVVNSTLKFNTAASMFANYAEGGAIFLFNSGTLTLTGSTVSTNEATDGATVGGSLFAVGGAIGMRGVANVRGSSFHGNEAVAPTPTGFSAGGAIWSTGLLRTVSTTKFTGNLAISGVGFGGAVEVEWSYFRGPAGPNVFTNVTFETNSAAGSRTSASGGAISVLSNPSVTNDGITLTHVTLHKNVATGTTQAEGGALCLVEEAFTGPVDVHNSVIVTNSTVSTNSALSKKSDAVGGGLAVDTRQPIALTVTDSVISHNLATASAFNGEAVGGGIYFQNQSNSLFSHDVISDNAAMSPYISYGGGMYDHYSDNITTIDHVTLSGNEAVTAGGGLSGGAGAVHITSSTIAKNVLTGTTVTLTPTTPGAPRTGFATGGGVSFESFYMTVLNSTIATNTANYSGSGFSYGGGLHILVVNAASFTSDTITANRAAYAGGVNVVGATALTQIAGSVISANTSLALTTTGKYLTSPTNCAVTRPFSTSGGNYLGSYSVVTEDASCTLAPSITTGTTPMLAPLANNGGGVLTRVPELGSPLLNNGGYACLGVDEIGQPRPAKDCTSGAFEESVGTGYTAVASDGGVFAFPSPLFHGSTGALTLNKPVVAMATTPAGLGYWLAASDGGIFAFGNASFLGSLPQLHVGVSDIVGIASTPDGLGYWMVGADGAVYAFGDAVFKGSLPGTGVTTTNIVGVAPHGSDGYWLVGSNGAVYAFGSANYRGGANTLVLNKEIVGIAADPTGEGYWLVGSDGGVFGYGSASGRYFGSMGGQHLNKPIVGIASTGDGEGYWLVASDGGVFNYGDATFQGSTGSLVLNKPVVGIS